MPSSSLAQHWDPNHVDADGSVGTYAYADCGKRFTEGRFPTGPAHVFTKTGYVQQSPLLGIITAQTTIVNNLLREFGLTPSSRTRIAVAPRVEEEPA